jgi:UDP-galactose transporter B1
MAKGIGALAIGAAGIWVSFLYFGYVQEDLLVYKDAKGDKFVFLWFLQTIEALANVIIGFIGRFFWSPAPKLPAMQLFAITGGAQVAAKYFTSASTTYGLAYPVATLAKSGKMVPVMLGTLLIGNAKYKPRDYAQVGLIVAGTALVGLAKSKGGGGSSLYGLACIILSLILDGIIGGTQKQVQKSLADYPFDIMAMTNVFMMLVGAVAAVAFGELVPGLEYLQANPDIQPKILSFALCSAIGQCFIFYTVANFGPLEVTAITTTRKIGTVLVSIFTKGHSMNAQGWLGITLATVGIMGEVQEKAMGHGSKDKAAEKKGE